MSIPSAHHGAGRHWPIRQRRNPPPGTTITDLILHLQQARQIALKLSDEARRWDTVGTSRDRSPDLRDLQE